MGKFVLGLVAGLIVGVLAMASNPDLPEDVRTALARVTGLVLRGTEEAAESIGEAADDVADEAREATGENPEAPTPRSGATEGVEPPSEPPGADGGGPARPE
jgi:hypothetical protein